VRKYHVAYRCPTRGTRVAAFIHIRVVERLLERPDIEGVKLLDHRGILRMGYAVPMFPRGCQGGFKLGPSIQSIGALARFDVHVFP